MSRASKLALERLADLWDREGAASRAQYRAIRHAVPFRERVARGDAIGDLEVVDTDAMAGGRTLLWLTTPRLDELDHVRFGPGDPVRLWWGDVDGGQADSRAHATVARRRKGRFGVAVDGDVPDRLLEGRFRLDREAPEATFERGQRAIARFAAAAESSDVGHLREIFFGEWTPGGPITVEWAPFDTDLNLTQLAAVAGALGARDVFLVHGPPGTGKTRTLVEIVRQAAARGERVLATAASNAAVDNLAAGLATAGADPLRLGHPARVAPEVEALTLDARLERSDAHKFAGQWVAEANALRRKLAARAGVGARRRLDWEEVRVARQEIRRLHRDARRALENAQSVILDRAAIVCATAAGADASILGDRRFDLVVLDEATQAPDPIALVPLGRGRRVVMAGDPRQLPPTVIDVDAAREGLGRTLFERLAEDPRTAPAYRLLSVQYRMHAGLMAFPSASMYDGRLRADKSVAAITLDGLPGLRADALRPGPLAFIDAAGKGWDEERSTEDPSVRNPLQAERVAAEVRRLLSRGLVPADLAVITPYAAQVRALRARLRPELELGLRIDSVDAFQGQEREAVIIDLVRCNERGEIGFLEDTRRMNVAVTRARRQLIVVGDGTTLGRHPYYAAFLEHVEHAGGWVSAWTDDAEPFDL